MQNKRIFKYGGIGLGVILVLGIIFAVKAKKGNIPELTTALVEKKNLVQSVNETGTVEANVKVEYGWERGGRVARVYKKVGDRVLPGELIAAFDGRSERSSLAQSVALLRSAEAALNVKFAGPTVENLRSSQASVDKARAGVLDAEANVKKIELANLSAVQQAERAFETAQNNLRSVQGGENSQIVNDAYEDLVHSLKGGLSKLNDALLEADNILGVDNRFANDEYEELLGKQDGSVLDIAKSGYLLGKTAVKVAEDKIVPLSPSASHSLVDEAILVVDKAILAVQSNLTQVKNVLNATLSGNNLSASELSTLKSNVLTSQSSLNTAATDITNNKQAVFSARNSLNSYTIALRKAEQDVENARRTAEVQKSVAQANLLSAKALLSQAEAVHAALIVKPREIDVASLRADVSRNRAGVASAQSEVSKTELRALSEGVVAKLDVEVGETVSPNTPVVTLLSKGLAIKLDISESEISKVAPQDKAIFTLDAFGEEVKFTGTVASIEPAETKVSGVVYYKTTLVLHSDQPRIFEVKPGMTANVSITTDTRDGALVIPGRAILDKDNKIVRVVTDKKKGTFVEREIKIGLKGDNGETEVLEGLKEGEEVVTFVKEKK